MVRVTEGITSQVKGPPAARSTKFGKYRVGLVKDEILLKFGPPVDVGDGGCVLTSLSICSQLYVRGSPSGSVAIAVNANGVFAGTVTFPLVLRILGALLAKGVSASQV